MCRRAPLWIALLVLAAPARSDPPPAGGDGTASRPDSAASGLVVIDAEVLARWPLRGHEAALALQPGVVPFRRDLALGVTSTEESRIGPALSVRGGRPAQAGTALDGFLRQDLLSGIPTLSITPGAIARVELLKPGFHPSQGRFAAGLVNVVTREGGTRLSGSIEAVTDNLAGRWIGADPTDYNVYAATLGGPLPGPGATFFVSAERRWLGDRRPSGATREMADMARAVLGAGETTPAEAAVLDALAENRLPANSLDGWSWHGKIALEPWAGSRITLGTDGSLDEWRRYQHEYLFDQVHAPRFEDRSLAGSVLYTQDVNEATRLRAAWGYAYAERNQGDGIYFTEIREYARPNSNPSFDQFVNLFFNTDDPATAVVRSEAGVVLQGDEAHVYNNYLRRIASTWGLHPQVTRRLGTSHELTVGTQVTRHAARRYHHFFPVNIIDEDRVLTPSGEFDVERYGFGAFAAVDDEGGFDDEKRPLEVAAYVEDRVAFEQVTLRLGVRYDYVDSRTEGLVDPLRPFDAGTPGVLDQADLEESQGHARVGPRVGMDVVASPTTSVHFDYGEFYQFPPFERALLGYRFLRHKVATGGYFADFGNPDLEPEEVTVYEAGISQALGTRGWLNAAVYHKRLSNLVTIRNVATTTGSGGAYISYRNEDFGTVKGVDLIARGRAGRLAAWASYGLSSARGRSSFPGTQRNVAWTAVDPVGMSHPLDFDQRHRIAVDVDFRMRPGEGPAWGGVHPLARAGVNVLVTFASGTPYTPTNIYNEVSLAPVAAQPVTGPNSVYGPWTAQVDLKVDRSFALGALDWNAYVWVLNLLDRDNAIEVYTSSGRATTTDFLETENGRVFVEHSVLPGSDADVADFYRLRELDPIHFGVPRLVRFGLAARF